MAALDAGHNKHLTVILFNTSTNPTKNILLLKKKTSFCNINDFLFHFYLLQMRKKKYLKFNTKKSVYKIEKKWPYHFSDDCIEDNKVFSSAFVVKK